MHATSLDKYISKHIGRRTNIQAKIGGTYIKMWTNVVYRWEGTNIVYIIESKEQEGKYMRTVRSNDKTYVWYNLISWFLKFWHTRVRKTKLLEVN